MGRADAAGRRALALTVWMALISMAAGREGAMAFTSFHVLTYNPTSYGTPYGTPSPPAPSGSSPFVPAAPAPSSSPLTPSYSPPYSPTTPSSPSPTYSPPAPPDSSGSSSPPYNPTPSSPSPDYTPSPPYSPTPSGSSPATPSSPSYSPAPSGSSPGTPYGTPYGSPAPSGSSPLNPTSPDAPLVPSVSAPATPSYAPPSTNPSNCPPISVVPSGPTDPYPPYTPSVPANPAPAASGTCTFWSGNTQLFPNFLTIFTTILDIFGGSSGSIFGSQMTLYQGLTNSRPDAFGSLLRQGSAAVLNSYTNRNYPYTPYQVKSAFRGALVSQQAAAVQAVYFENANRGFVKRQ